MITNPLYSLYKKQNPYDDGTVWDLGSQLVVPGAESMLGVADPLSAPRNQISYYDNQLGAIGETPVVPTAYENSKSLGAGALSTGLKVLELATTPMASVGNTLSGAVTSFIDRNTNGSNDNEIEIIAKSVLDGLKSGGATLVNPFTDKYKDNMVTWGDGLNKLQESKNGTVKSIANAVEKDFNPAYYIAKGLGADEKKASEWGNLGFDLATSIATGKFTDLEDVGKALKFLRNTDKINDVSKLTNVSKAEELVKKGSTFEKFINKPENRGLADDVLKAKYDEDIANRVESLVTDTSKVLGGMPDFKGLRLGNKVILDRDKLTSIAQDSLKSNALQVGLGLYSPIAGVLNNPLVDKVSSKLGDTEFMNSLSNELTRKFGGKYSDYKVNAKNSPKDALANILSMQNRIEGDTLKSNNVNEALDEVASLIDDKELDPNKLSGYMEKPTQTNIEKAVEQYDITNPEYLTKARDFNEQQISKLTNELTKKEASKNVDKAVATNESTVPLYDDMANRLNNDSNTLGEFDNTSFKKEGKTDWLSTVDNGLTKEELAKEAERQQWLGDMQVPKGEQTGVAFDTVGKGDNAKTLDTHVTKSYSDEMSNSRAEALRQKKINEEKLTFSKAKAIDETVSDRVRASNSLNGKSDNADVIKTLSDEQLRDYVAYNTGRTVDDLSGHTRKDLEALAQVPVSHNKVVTTFYDNLTTKNYNTISAMKNVADEDMKSYLKQELLNSIKKGEMPSDKLGKLSKTIDSWDRDRLELAVTRKLNELREKGSKTLRENSIKTLYNTVNGDYTKGSLIQNKTLLNNLGINFEDMSNIEKLKYSDYDLLVKLGNFKKSMSWLQENNPTAYDKVIKATGGNLDNFDRGTAKYVSDVFDGAKAPTLYKSPVSKIMTNESTVDLTSKVGRTEAIKNAATVEPIDDVKNIQDKIDELKANFADNDKLIENYEKNSPEGTRASKWKTIEREYDKVLVIDRTKDLTDKEMATIENFQKQFEQMAIEEGLDKRRANYVSHILNPLVDKEKARAYAKELGLNIDDPFNIFAKERKLEGTIEDINAKTVKDADFGEKLFDENLFRIFLKRKMGHENFMYQQKMSDDLFDNFSHQIKSSSDLSLPEMQKYSKDFGYDVPDINTLAGKSYDNFFNNLSKEEKANTIDVTNMRTKDIDELIKDLANDRKIAGNEDNFKLLMKEGKFIRDFDNLQTAFTKSAKNELSNAKTDLMLAETPLEVTAIQNRITNINKYIKDIPNKVKEIKAHQESVIEKATIREHKKAYFNYVYNKAKEDGYVIVTRNQKLEKQSVKELDKTKLNEDDLDIEEYVRQSMEQVEGASVGQGYKVMDLKDSEYFTKTNEDLFLMPKYALDTYNTELEKLVKKDKEGLLKAFDTFNNIFKAQAVMSLKFHANNIVGNVLNSWLAGGVNLISPEKIKLASDIEKGKEGKIGKYTYKQITEEMSKRNLFQNQLANEFKTDNVKAYLDGKVDDLSGTNNPVFKLAKGVNNINTNISSKIENQAKIINFITHLENGMSLKEAEDLTKKALFDYSDLSDFEVNVVKRIIPFYTFLRKNLPLQFDNLQNKTFKSMLVYKGYDDANKATQDDQSRGIRPDYTKEMLPTGANSFINLSNPMLDVSKAVSPTSMLGSLTPALKTPLELFLNKQLYSGADISKYDKTSEKMQYAVESANPLISRLSKLYNNVSSGDNSGKGNVLSSLLGLTTTYDMDKAQKQTMYNYVTQLQNQYYEALSKDPTLKAKIENQKKLQKLLGN